MKVQINTYAYAGTTDFFKVVEGNEFEVEVIKQMREKGTDIMFAINDDGRLIYFTPNCITKFI